MSRQHSRCRRNDSLNNESSQEELEKLFSAIMQWRDTYDPNNEIFHEVWRLANEKYESQHKLISIKSYNTTDTKEAEPSAVAQVIDDCDKEFDPTQDSANWSYMEETKEKLDIKKINQIRKSVNKKANEFVPHSQILSNPQIPLLPNMNLISNMLPCLCPLPLPPPLPLPLLPLLPNINLISNTFMPCLYPLPINQNNFINNQQFKPFPQHTNYDNKTETGDDYEIFEFEPNPKYSNRARGNFFLPHEKTKEWMAECVETFHTKILNDAKLAFGYFKESVAMEINNKHLYIIRTFCGDVIIINIDLHFANGRGIMYFIAMQNDIEHRHKVKWKIIDFMSADMIYRKFRITTKLLPKSSRNTPRFIFAMNNPPQNVPINVIFDANLKDLPCKDPNKKEPNSNKITHIRESGAKLYFLQSWNNGIMIPVVVVKGSNVWVEWKKCIKIYDENKKAEWIAISLRYNAVSKQWKIVCLDYDLGRVFYQHRLVGTNHNYCCSYNDLAGHITTSLDIYIKSNSINIL